MFSAAPARPSLVETANRIGLPFRRWLFAAIVTGLSAMEWASFARVFPVQGAITRISNSFFGPMGSAWQMGQMGSRPQIWVALTKCSFAVPNRLSMVQTF